LSDELRCRLTLKDGNVLDFYIPKGAVDFVEKLGEFGYHDERTGCYYPKEALREAEIWNPDDDQDERSLGPFSLN
jgi:hypothetical protein